MYVEYIRVCAFVSKIKTLWSCATATRVCDMNTSRSPQFCYTDLLVPFMLTLPLLLRRP